MATRTSRAVFGDITNAGDSVAALAGKKPLKSERKAAKKAKQAAPSGGFKNPFA